MPTTPESTSLDAVRRLVQQACGQPGGLCVLTGAGMSAESGIPTFRDALTGHWAHLDPMEMASDAGFRSNPARVWGWYAERRDGVRRAEPNVGHRALGNFEVRHPGVLTVITQNVDDLHQRAGNLDTLRLHGDILQDRWLDPCPRGVRGPACETGWALEGEPPRCGECGNALRPGVVWFGESLPLGVMNAAEAAVDGCRLLLVVGTSGAVWPAAGLAHRARRRGVPVVIVNPEASEIDDQAHHVLRGTAAGLLPALLDAPGPMTGQVP